MGQSLPSASLFAVDTKWGRVADTLDVFAAI